ncbi:mitochondrial peptide methionine sulfoxide reductase isoform X3 [Pungitius pungitius]|uniref:mitochondrial peptide methionine sulfoxide reductase isoform X3 n=1 Tax=Pungitius pungitius TaxID=134920 RepID=UPI002E0F51E0
MRVQQLLDLRTQDHGKARSQRESHCGAFSRKHGDHHAWSRLLLGSGETFLANSRSLHHTGLTGHTEVVRVVFSPEDVRLEELLKRFWENHDPTQGMRQQNDRGTQYRSAIYTSNPAQQEAALKSKVAFQQELDKKGYGQITTEIREGQLFYYAEDYHQQYLKKVPKGYCGLKGTGVSCPIGAGKDEL